MYKKNDIPKFLHNKNLGSLVSNRISKNKLPLEAKKLIKKNLQI